MYPLGSVWLHLTYIGLIHSLEGNPRLVNLYVFGEIQSPILIHCWWLVQICDFQVSLMKGKFCRWLMMSCLRKSEGRLSPQECPADKTTKWTHQPGSVAVRASLCLVSSRWRVWRLPTGIRWLRSFNPQWPLCLFARRLGSNNSPAERSRIHMWPYNQSINQFLFLQR